MVPVPQNLLNATTLETPLPLTHSNDLHNIDDHGQDGSHGTLLLDKEGRARYLGPTAGSEWLKDVSLFNVLVKSC